MSFLSRTDSEPHICPVGKTPLSQADGTAQVLMCPPTFFEVTYAINPWMITASPEQGGCDVTLARKQWEKLYEAITDRAGATVHLMPPVQGLPDLVFTANAAFVYENQAIIAHYKHPERQGEEPFAADWFKQAGFQVTELDPAVHFEGAGDALTWQAHNTPARVFSGYRTRTDIASHNLITEKTGLPVLSLELISDQFYHIDVCICPLSNGYFIYYPDAFDTYGQTVIEENIPAEKRIPVTAEEAAQFACNSVNINDTVIFNEGSPRLTEALRERGFQVIHVNLSEFIKGGGSAKCLTLRVG